MRFTSITKHDTVNNRFTNPRQIELFALFMLFAHFKVKKHNSKEGFL
jgi:hypothetical protein